ncbi:MAG: hypothetical protein ACOY0T_32455 [Myxococcota bacterium]
MIRQRLIALVLPALVVVACGGGPGSAARRYDPDAPPDIADQNPVITESKPPDYSQPPGGSTNTSTPGTPGGGGGTCETICARLVRSDCEFETDDGTQLTEADCPAACVEIRDAPCSSQLLAVMDCIYGAGHCPEEIENDEELAQQLAARCYTQAQAYAACEEATDNGNDSDSNN